MFVYFVKGGGHNCGVGIGKSGPKLEVPFRVHLDCQRPASKVAGNGVLLEGHSELVVCIKHSSYVGIICHLFSLYFGE